LDAEAQQIAQHCADGDDKAGEVDLTEHGLVGGEGGGGLVQTVGEIEPTDVTSHIEQGLRYTIGTHLGNASEHYHVHDDSEDGLDDIP